FFILNFAIEHDNKEFIKIGINMFNDFIQKEKSEYFEDILRTIFVLLPKYAYDRNIFDGNIFENIIIYLLKVKFSGANAKYLELINEQLLVIREYIEENQF